MHSIQLSLPNQWYSTLIRNLLFLGLYSQQLLGIGVKNNLDFKILKMLEPESLKDFNDGILQINLNTLLGFPNYVNAIILLFFTLEREFCDSIVQLMRWYGGANMPQDYNKHSPGRKIDYNGRDPKRNIHFNKFTTVNGYIVWQAPTIGESLNCFETFCKKQDKPFFEQGNQAFISDCRKLIDLANHMRHFQSGLVSLEQAVAFKEHLENFLYSYLPTLNRFKRVLRGDFGYDIGTPPDLNIKINILNPHVINELNSQNIFEIFSSSAS